MTRNYTLNIDRALWAILCAVALGLGFLSCSKEQIVDNDNIISQPTEEDTPDSQDPDTPENPGEEPEIRPQVTIHVGLEEEGSRINIEKGDAGLLHTAWAAGDKLRVGRDSNAEEKIFTIQEGFTDHIAEFSGEALGEGQSYYVIYPSNISWNYIFSKDYNGVKQVGNDNTDHIDYCVMLSGMTSFPSSLLLTDRYAEREGLLLRKSSVIKFYLKLPAEAVTPTRLEIKAGKVGDTEGSDHIFYANNNEDSRTNALTLYLDSVTPNNQTITAYLSIPWFGYSVAAGQSLTISAYYDTEGGDHKVVSKSITPGAGTFGGGQTILYQVNMTKGSTTSTNTDGDGTAENPYILSTADDLLAMKGKLLNEETVYFEMDADIDMASIPNWAPLNNSQQINFKRYINFNGNNHLIKNLRCTGEAYASFFGVLCGECRNTGFVDAYIEGNNTCAGIITAYLGLDDPGKVAETGLIDQCYTSGYVTSNGTSVGGLAGQIGALYSGTKSTISNSYSSAMVEGNSCGGLAGLLKNGSQIQGSYFCGVNVSPGAYWMGGIAAKANDDYYATKPIINQCASLTKTTVSPHSGANNTVFRIARPNGMSVTNCLVWNGTNGNLRYSSDTQTNTLSEVQTLFTSTLGSSKGWSSTLDGDFPLLTWQVTRGDYATYAGHGRDYFDGGDGSSSDPFLISQAYQLYNMEEHLSSSDTTYFKLTANVDMSAIDNWSPINKSNSGLLINWDGNHKTLSNLNMTWTSGYSGLFGILLGKVSDLTLKDFTLVCSGSTHCGILAGFLATAGSGYARLKNVIIDGGSCTMNGSGAVGSLGGNCGYIYASGCSSSAEITQNSTNNADTGYCCGGLVGCTRNSSETAVFENCAFSGNLTGYDASGGILGLTASTTEARIVGCNFSGSITAQSRTAVDGKVDALSGNSVGGIVGYHKKGMLTDCSATATSSVSGNNYVGGIVGYYNHTSAAYAFTGNDSYGDISGSGSVGGIIGRFLSTQGSQISHCHAYYAAGNKVQATSTCCGGIVGWFRGSSAPASGETFSDCSSSATLQSSSNYVAGIVGYAAEESGGTNHSILSMNRCSSSGTLSTSSNSCGGIIGGMRAKSFSMTNCSSSAAISVDATYAGGLIAYLSGQYTSGDAGDISISDCSFSGTVSAGSNRAGGLVGEAYECPGTMVRCRTVNPQGSSVSVSATRWCGGLIGSMSTNATLSLSDCSSQGTVAVSDTTAGGIIGRSASKKLILDHCVNAASVTIAGSGESNENTHRDAGGVIGYLYGGNFADDEDLSITDCSNSGSITAAVNCGGIIGRATACTLGSSISGCTNSGNITSRYRHSGGIIGYSLGSTFTLSECGTTGTPTILSANYSGGLVGRIGTSGSINLSDCQTSGSINSNPNSSAGGLVGASYTTLSITDCRSSANVTSSDKYAGGLVGYAINSTLSISNSFSSGNIQAVESAGGLIGECRNTLTLTACGHNTGYIQYDSEATYVNDQICSIGGLVGRVCGSGTISLCAAKDCDVTGPCCIGGLVGYFGPTDSSTPTLTIQESYYHGGTILATGTGNTRAAGGILGKNYANSSAYTNTVIQDCYSRGTITVDSSSGGQVVGGIVGEAMAGLTAEYCISDCEVSAPRCAGGIIGRACNGGWTYSNDGKVKVERCICWSPSVTGTATGNSSASSGAVIGFTSKLNWLYKCYYNPNMTFSGINVKNTLVQQNAGGGFNTTYEDATAAIVPGTTAGTWTTSPYTYVMPYHGGTVANSGRSACTVAQAIGFASRVDAESQTIWNLFSGGTYNPNFIMPELNHLRESSDTAGSISDMNNNPIFEEGDF